MRCQSIFALLPVALMAASPLAGQVRLTQGQDQIAVEINGKPFTTFYYGAAAPKPYLHPLTSATGKVVTRRFPMEQVAGEATDHRHHRGLWFTHGDVNGFDFWMNEADYKATNRGRIVLRKIDNVKSGKKEGTIRATFDWLDPQGQKLLTERRTMTFYAQPETLRMLDIEVEFSADKEVKFGDTKEGTFAIRLAQSLNEKGGTGRMVNAEGGTGMKQVWGKRSPWVDYAGEVDGEKLGVAILDHPANPKHPTFWHARDYGLFAANPFGEHDFYNDKSRDGSLTARPGVPLRFTYRVVIHPGDAQGANVSKLFEEFAAKNVKE